MNQASPAPTASAASGHGPYVVQQTRSLGGETLAGEVCRTSAPFTVTAAAPKVTFAFQFVPGDAASGTWTYAYSIESAGESHSASGTYTIGTPAADGTLLLSMSGSDHVVFKGFDGNMPLKYDFKLAPSAQTHCAGG